MLQFLAYFPYFKTKEKELIAYFPLIRHGPNRKENNYGDTHRQKHRQQGDLISLLYFFYKIGSSLK
jgi:hypothetical protein